MFAYWICTVSCSIDCQEIRAFDLTKHAPLPEQIHSATSPRRRPSTRKWPPESPAVRKFWRYENKTLPPANEKVVSLTSYIRELDEKRKKPPSPKRHLLRESARAVSQIKQPNAYYYNESQKEKINGILSHDASPDCRVIQQIEKLEEHQELSESTASVSREPEWVEQHGDDTVSASERTVQEDGEVEPNTTNESTCNIAHFQDSKQTLLTFAPPLTINTSENLQPWTNSAEILEEGDLATEENFAQNNGEDESVSLPPFDKDTTEFLEKGARYFCDYEESGTTAGGLERDTEDNHNDQKAGKVPNSGYEEEQQDAEGTFHENGACYDSVSKQQENKSTLDEDKELWMKEEVEEAKRESERDAKMEVEHLEELRRYDVSEKITESVRKPDVPRRSIHSSRPAMKKQSSFEAEQKRLDDIRRVEEYRNLNISRLTEHSLPQSIVWHETFEDRPKIFQNDGDFMKETVVRNGAMSKVGEKTETTRDLRKENDLREFEKLKDLEKMRLQDENDKRLAIESIERHQRQLREQQVQLSQLLDNAIVFLKNLDTEGLKRSPEPCTR